MNSQTTKSQFVGKRHLTATKAASTWLCRAQDLDSFPPERYNKLVRHIRKVATGKRVTKSDCLKALVNLWAEEEPALRARLAEELEEIDAQT